MSKRRNHDAAFKARVALEAVKKTLAAAGANQDAAGHWGVPLMVFEGEPFFGQDRVDALLWRMEQRGLQAL